MNTSLQLLNTSKLKEDAIVGGFFLSLILPLRLVFYTYLSHYWLGSFGVLSLVSLSLFFLARKGKLGFFGPMLLNVFNRRTKGKSFKVIVIMSILVIYLSSLIVSSNIYADNTAYTKTKTDLKNMGVTNMTSLQTYDNSHPSTMSLTDHLIWTLVLLTPNPFSFVVYKTANDLLNGWLFTIFTLVLAQEIEFLAIIIYLRYRSSKLV